MRNVRCEMWNDVLKMDVIERLRSNQSNPWICLLLFILIACAHAFAVSASKNVALRQCSGQASMKLMKNLRYRRW